MDVGFEEEVEGGMSEKAMNVLTVQEFLTEVDLDL